MEKTYTWSWNDTAYTDNDFDAAVVLMDDEIREDISEDIAPCSKDEFMTTYQKKHFAKYGEYLVW